MKFNLLFDAEGPRIALHAGPQEGPVVGSIEPLVEKLRAGQETLRRIPADDLIGLCDAAATAWTRPDHPLAATIRRQGLGFLPLWMRRKNLAEVSARSLRGRLECLDGFVRLSQSDPTLLRAQPRGLVVHWVAGNVPVLGMLSLLQSFLCKNANLLKVSRVSAGTLPQLLEGFAGVSYTNREGRTVGGSVLTDTVAAVYCDRNDDEAARALSGLADVRLAWGGREAVESIMNLPRRVGAEDIVFGPKLSLAVVGAERLPDTEAARQLATALARDASAFDQQGCNSPHTVFVERGGNVSGSEFAGLLAEAMQTVTRNAPLQQVDAAGSVNVLGVRAEYDMRGEAYYSRGTDWTVVYADEDEGLADPCFLRTLFVRPVDDVFAVAPFCSPQTQTAGLAVDSRRLALADALTARGVERCPDVGNMRIYETPWDGLFPMDRLVRWVSTY